MIYQSQFLSSLTGDVPKSITGTYNASTYEDCYCMYTKPQHDNIINRLAFTQHHTLQHQEQTKTRQINAYVYYKGISNSITNKCKELNQLACIKQFDIITTYTQDSWKVRGGILNYIKYSITSTHINTEPQNVIINTNKHKYVTVANLYIPP